MQILSSGNMKIQQLIASRGNSSCIYVPSKHLLQLDVDNKLLLLNSLTGELLLLSCQEKELFQKLPQMYNTKFSEFVQHHIIVKENTDEIRLVQQLRALLRIQPKIRTLVTQNS